MNENSLPKHVAIIMDGNGRWAKQRALPKIAGHRAGAAAARNVVDKAEELGIKFLTLYTFSTENWNRPKEEVNNLLNLLGEYLNKSEDKFNEHNVRFNVLGKIRELPPELSKKLTNIMESTSDNTGLALNLALNYGARLEIVDCVRKICHDVKDGLITCDDINEETISKNLYTSGMPDPDLIIRTSGEFRVSNFLLWQASYAEFYVSEKYWPDFTGEDLVKAILAYERRDRRYGR